MNTMTLTRPDTSRTLGPQPLFVTDDPHLLMRLRSLSDRVGAAHRATSDTAIANRHWLSASTIIVGSDMARAVAIAGLPERSDLILVTQTGITQEEAWPIALSIGAQHVISLPEAEDWLTNRLDPHPPPIPMSPVIAVTGALGGVGASTFASAIAVLAARQATASLVDTDTSGPGIDFLLGWERLEGRRWPSIVQRRQPFDPGRWRDSIPVRKDLAVISADAGIPVSPNSLTLRSIVDTCRHTSALTVVDVPRHGERTIHSLNPDLLVVIVPPEVRAIAAARSALRRRPPASTGIVVRRAAGISARTVAEAVGSPLIGEMGDDPTIASIISSGRFADRVAETSLATTARSVLDALGRRQ